jgi:dipeptidyl aminopeptidase/acylaminoacyl peptidase
MLTAMLVLALFAASATKPLILSRAPYPFAPWDSLARADRFVGRNDYEATANDAAFTFERITYAGDSLRVAAYLAAPRAPSPTPRPCVVYVRGGWTVGDIGWQLAPTFRRLVNEGFVVIAPLLRGSNGEAGVDEMGGAELSDLMRASEIVLATGWADTSQLFLYGESRGGMMVFQALRDGFPARAAATFGAFTDLDSMIAADTTHLEPMARRIWPTWPTDRSRIADRRSALRWPERLRVPLLLMHGADDHQVRPRESIALAQAIRRTGGVCEVRIVWQAGHTLRGNEVARDSAAVAWFRSATSGRGAAISRGKLLQR